MFKLHISPAGHLLLHVLGSLHQPARRDGLVKSIMHLNPTTGFPDKFHDAPDVSLRYNCSLQPSVLMGFVGQGFETLQQVQNEQEKLMREQATELDQLRRALEALEGSSIT